jgi:hypothetical protein
MAQAKRVAGSLSAYARAFVLAAKTGRWEVVSLAHRLHTGPWMAAKAKQVKSDLKDLQPGKRGAEFPSDREKVKGERPDRRAKGASARAQRVPRVVPKGDNEQRGGRDRAERKHRSAAGSPAHRRG